jgi:CHAT domain-containing protein
LNALQTDVHKAMLALDAGGSSERETKDELSDQINALSYQYPIVHFHVGRNDLIGFVHYRGDARSCLYTDGLEIGRRLAAEWRFMAERVPALHDTPDAAHLADENRILDRISHWLLDRLELPTESKRLLVVPDGFLANLPWWALRVGGQPLVDRYELTLSPSIRHHLHARNRTGSSRHVRVFVGDTTGLQSVDREVASVLSGFESSDTSCFSLCARADWPDKDEARVWHFVGHAQLRADNPFYSALMLKDGPMFAADFRLKQCSVDLVMLAACRTGQQSGRAGEENGGLVRSLLEMGAKSVVASHWAVSDRAAGPWSEQLYDEFRGGASVTRAAQAATLRMRERFPSAYHWSAFSVFGAW